MRGYPALITQHATAICCLGNPPFLTGCIGRTSAAISSFMAGVMPPMRTSGRRVNSVQAIVIAVSSRKSTESQAPVFFQLF